MLITLPDDSLALVDRQTLPRYWAVVWSIFYAGNLAHSTRKRKLLAIEALYIHAEQTGSCLDDEISKLDVGTIGNVLEAYFVGLINQPNPSVQTPKQWSAAFRFVRDVCERIARDPRTGRKMADIQEKIGYLDKLYIGLRPMNRRINNAVRALPKVVVEEMLDILRPDSSLNPFVYKPTQWRIYCLVTMMLFQGLRRGELLALKIDSLELHEDHRSGEHRWLLRVSENDVLLDTRKQKPSIKTAGSIRTTPVTNTTANVIQTYLENYRGKADHPYLLSSVRRAPLSIEAVNKAFLRISEALSDNAHQALQRATGKETITPHMLRHTCAVLRMRQLLSMGKSPEQAMSLLRSFFGWERNSLMPLRYAKAAMDELLNEAWHDVLDDRLEFLRGLM